MGFEPHYAAKEPARAELDALREPILLEFGTAWCGWCRDAQAAIASALAAHSRVRHLKVEDGRGRPLGRSFGVKLWPTMIFLKDGREVTRLVRPGDVSALVSALAQIDPPP